MDIFLKKMCRSSSQNFGANQKNFWVNAGLIIPDEQVTVEDRFDSIYNSEGMGGKIKLESALDEGTSIMITLPNMK